MLEALLTPVDIYCERHGPQFWAEPVNALTNVAFVAAGLWGLRKVRAAGGDGFAQILCWWVVAIGLGSALFHTFANRLTMWADILPIASFTVAYTIFTLRRYLGLNWPACVAIVACFYVLAGVLTALVPAWVSQATYGSTGYLPAFLALFVFGAVVAAVGHPAGRYILAAVAVFVISVTFRALDGDLCDHTPFGTHFMWHVLNGAMLAILLAAAARFGSREASSAPIRR
jgi:hypothetical protein